MSMVYKNGFFQIIIKDDGTYIRIYPAMSGGEVLTFSEVDDYLQKKKIVDYDTIQLNDAIVKSKAPTEIKLNSSVILPENEFLILKADNAGLQVNGRFYPPSNKGKMMSKDEIISDLVHMGVKYGIIEENINSFLKARKYCTDILLAKGTLPVQGKDAVITYYFNTDMDMKPQVNEDGSVDFHKLDIISHVNKGDVLATLEPADFGTAGIDVYGRRIEPDKVKNKVLQYGRMISISEDNKVITADVSGHVTLIDNKVFVSDMYEVLADVDASTGDIEYDGNVTVKGNVITGFSIKSKGDIVVEGVVEGASLIAGGNIILKRGIQGMNRGVLKAEGNIITKFIENSEVFCNGYISTDSIMHSKVFAKGDIVVSGKKGFVTGGEVHSGTMIDMKTAGSIMGTQTILEVGIDPNIVQEFRQIEKELESISEEKEKIVQIINLFKKKLAAGEKILQDKMVLLQNCSKSYNEMENKETLLNKRHEELGKLMEDNTCGCIKVRNIAYPGVKVVISNVIYFVRNEIHYSQFEKERAEIRVSPLKA